jgi:hypothetical protein
MSSGFVKLFLYFRACKTSPEIPKPVGMPPAGYFLTITRPALWTKSFGLYSLQEGPGDGKEVALDGEKGGLSGRIEG